MSDLGMANSHAYTVLGLLELGDGEDGGTTTRLVKMRNPWGYETYHGPWSDSDDSAWSEDLLDEAGHKISNNGVFFMPIEQYHQQIQTTFISRDTTGWN